MKLRDITEFLKSKRFLKVFGISIAVVFFIIMFCNWRVNFFAKPFLYDNTDSIPYNKVGLILGTSKYLVGGYENPYFENRIIAAVELYMAGKVTFFIVSGDNQYESYNEPKMMKAELIKRGIPAEMITLDYAGFRTLDSVVRSKEVFGQTKITIISQEFHNERAIFIAYKKGIEAVGFNAKDVDKTKGLKTNLRELIARVKLMIDLYILNTQPRFLGDEIPVDTTGSN